MDVTLVTPTRDRPEAFALCARYVARARAAFGGTVEWLVVDDGDTPAKAPTTARVLRRAPSPARNTLPENLLDALPEASGDVVLIIEDDDWYSERYIAEMVRLLAPPVNIAGECLATYYNVRERRWHRPPQNTRHASLCRTGFRYEALVPFLAAAQIAKSAGSPFVDLLVWGLTPGVDRAALRPHLARGLNLSIGIKGMPGRGGLGAAHGPCLGWTGDPELAYLRGLVGSDADAYAPYYDDHPGVHASRR